MALKCASLCLLLVTFACAESKPTVELPPVEAGYEFEVVTTLAEGLEDVASMAVAGDLLLVADDAGLFIYDITDAAAPVLRSSMTAFPVHRVRPVADVAYTIAVDDDNLLRAIDISDPDAPSVVREISSPTARFGGLGAQPGLIWHAVGQIPPSRLYYGEDPESLRSCEADDRERGAMDAWLFGKWAVLSIHFDDYAGDGLDGNGAFGFVIWEISGAANSCPSLKVRDVVFSVHHDANRSSFERPQNSDLQADYDPDARRLYLTGEQRLAILDLSEKGRATEVGSISIPEILAAHVDRSCVDCGALALVANGDVGLIDVTDGGDPALVGFLETPGIARSVVAAGDGRHAYVADGKDGVLVVAYQKDGL